MKRRFHRKNRGEFMTLDEAIQRENKYVSVSQEGGE